MSIIIDKRRIELARTKSFNFEDDAAVAPRITDFDKRTRAIRAIVVHTTSGTCSKGTVKPAGLVRDDKQNTLAIYQTKTARQVSWDFTVGRDGDVICQNDPVELYSWHATAWNPISVGIELVQDDDGGLYANQLEAFVDLVDTLTRTLRIQRQVAFNADGSPCLKKLARADEKAGRGANMVGVFAHCHNTDSRGPGDPGPAPFRALFANGYERFDFGADADLAEWKRRQAALGFTGKDVDGIALTKTCDALVAAGKPHGLWVSRPGDGA